jgi:hypothetical protein
VEGGVMTFEELIADHERLCGEIEELKKKFIDHRHYTHENSVPNPLFPDLATWETSTPKKIEPTLEEIAEAKCREEFTKLSGTGKCMDCGKQIEYGQVICKDCIPF